MINANSLNAMCTAVIALTTSIGVLSTLIYYLANIKGIPITILILISTVYITLITAFIKKLRDTAEHE